MKYDPVNDCAKQLRQSMSEIDFELDDKFCDETDLRNSYYNMKIPQVLLRFLSVLLNFDEKNFIETASNMSEVNNEDSAKNDNVTMVTKIYSFFQQMYYLRHGCMKLTPLHVMTALSIHGICKCKYLLTSLNHLGFCIGYDEVMRIRQALASLTIESSENNVILPYHFNFDKFTFVAFDTIS